MIRLPRLMLGANFAQLLSIAASVEDDEARAVEIDATELMTAEPVALCLLASALAHLERRGQTAIVRNVDPRVKQSLERMDVLAPWLHAAEDTTDRRSPQAPIQARRVSSGREANAVANALARGIASFVPEEDVAAILQDDPDLRRYRAVEQPVGYVMSELLDNALNHSRAGGFGHSAAWVAAQYYPAGDLMRVCVLDDGCGFLRTLRDHPRVVPKTDLVALETAFEPFLSCKRDVRVFRDSTHQGIGLTVCRDLCLLAGGRVEAISGRARVINPGCDGAVSTSLSTPHQGAIMNLEFHRRSITPNTIGEILRRYQPDENLPIRFFTPFGSSVGTAMTAALNCGSTVLASTDPSIFILGTREEAIPLRRRVEHALDQSERAVCVDFGGTTVTQSFVDEFIGVLILRRGPAILERLGFRQCSAEVQAVIRFVVSSRIQDFNDQRSGSTTA